MPYVITTHRHLDDPVAEFLPGALPGVSRRAVATLEEARDYAHDLVIGFDPNHEPFGPCARATLDLPEFGGTVGPLPGDTMIEVERVEWQAVMDAVLKPMIDAGRSTFPAFTTHAQIIDAYNAQGPR